MAEYPALPLFTDAYMADTRHLTAAQHGAYLLLLMTAWRMPDCRLPDDDLFLSRCASMDMRTWKLQKDKIMAFWKKDDLQKWYQPRLLDERKYVDELRNKNSQAGQASALKRLNRGSTSVPTKRQPKFNPHTHTHTPPTPSTSIPIKTLLSNCARGNLGSGFENEKKDEGVGKEKKWYDVKEHLDKMILSVAASHAPLWDINHLVRVYNAGVNNGRRVPPTDPDKAFPAWVKKYTKGKKP